MAVGQGGARERGPQSSALLYDTEGTTQKVPRSRRGDLGTSVVSSILVAAAAPPRAVAVGAPYTRTAPPVAVAISMRKAIAMAIGTVSVVTIVALAAPPASTLIVISLSHGRNCGGHNNRSRYCQPNSSHHVSPLCMATYWGKNNRQYGLFLWLRASSALDAHNRNGVLRQTTSAAYGWSCFPTTGSALADLFRCWHLRR